jgi:sterol desaturase/sphingolipid hydroxylase (fatty acid hydroxylase superfamily)
MARNVAAPLLVVGILGMLLWVERRRPLRPYRDPSASRVVRNLAVGVLAATTVNLLERPVTEALAAQTERRRWGLMPRLPLPAALKTAFELALMDYTLYVWHVLLHRVPLLWRCHRAHHADLDLDASTAARFHFAEFALSVPWRAAQVVAIGVSSSTLALWRTLTMVEVVFHHSNVRLPAGVERALGRAIVTPRLHGIHHSKLGDQRESNFSSGLSCWDLLHGTARRDVPQGSIIIGLPEYRRPEQVTLARTLALPFASTPADMLHQAASTGPARAPGRSPRAGPRPRA